MYPEQEAALVSEKYKNTREKNKVKNWKKSQNLIIKQKHNIN